MEFVVTCFLDLCVYSLYDIIRHICLIKNFEIKLQKVKIYKDIIIFWMSGNLFCDKLSLENFISSVHTLHNKIQ